MKNTFLKISVAMIAGLVSQVAFAGDVLVQPTTIQVRTLDSSIHLENLEATYTARCRYHSGIFFPEAKDCGGSSVKVPINEDGTIRLPALQKVSGLHGRKARNYQVSISLRPKNQTPRDQEYFFTLVAYTEEAFKTLENFRDVIYIGRLKGTVLNITADRRPLLGGELSRLPDAYLLVSAYVNGTVKTDMNSPLLSSGFSMNLQSFENRQNPNGTVNKELMNTESIEIKGGNFAFIGNPADATVTLDVSLSTTENSTKKIIYRKAVVGKIDSDFLKDNRNVDLEKVK